MEKNMIDISKVKLSLDTRRLCKRNDLMKDFDEILNFLFFKKYGKKLI